MTDFTVPEAVNAARMTFPTPFHLYDVKTMRENTSRLYQAMEQAGVKDFQNYFAVKALPNPHVLRELVTTGHGLDCSSLAELALAEQVGMRGDQIMFTSNNTSDEEFARADELGAIINFDDELYADRYIELFGAPAFACGRFNPGELFTSTNGKDNMLRGTPAEQKYGMSREHLTSTYQTLKAAGTERFGLHAMLLSNNRSWQNHADVARLLFQTAKEIAEEVGIEFSFINLGGGIGVAYAPEDEPFDYEAFAQAVAEAYEDAGLERCGSPRVVMENGRAITATAGWLVTRVQNVKHSYKTYIGVDASMANLMRPGMYGAYHHISLLGDDGSRQSETVDVVGSLCENNDKFAVDRRLPKLELGDILVIHTTGAHGHAMGFNYNGRLRSAELLADGNDLKVIRRAETLDDLLATITPLEPAV